MEFEIPGKKIQSHSPVSKASAPHDGESDTMLDETSATNGQLAACLLPSKQSSKKVSTVLTQRPQRRRPKVQRRYTKKASSPHHTGKHKLVANIDTDATSTTGLGRIKKKSKINYFIRNILKDCAVQENKLRLSEDIACLFEEDVQNFINNIINCAAFFTISRRKLRIQTADMHFAIRLLQQQ